jgi:hypothetical protein
LHHVQVLFLLVSFFSSDRVSCFCLTLSISASQVAGIASVSHHTWPSITSIYPLDARTCRLHQMCPGKQNCPYLGYTVLKWAR